MMISLWAGSAAFVLGLLLAPILDYDLWRTAGIMGLSTVIVVSLIGMGWILERPRKTEGGAKQQVTKLAVTVQEPGTAFAWGMFHDLPITQAQLIKIAEMLLRDASFTHRRFIGVVMNDNEFTQLRDLWVSAGILVWDNPRAHQRGCKVSPVGRKIMQKLVTTETGTQTHSHTQRRY